MTDIDDMLSNITHRPFALPDGQWKYYPDSADLQSVPTIESNPKPALAKEC